MLESSFLSQKKLYVEYKVSFVLGSYIQQKYFTTKNSTIQQKIT